jgi:hypothetical protein
MGYTVLTETKEENKMEIYEGVGTIILLTANECSQLGDILDKMVYAEKPQELLSEADKDLLLELIQSM